MGRPRTQVEYEAYREGALNALESFSAGMVGAALVLGVKHYPISKIPSVAKEMAEEINKTIDQAIKEHT